MRDKKRKVYLSLAVALVIMAALVIKARQGGSSAAKLISKEINPAYGSIQASISTTGTIQPQNRLEVKPPIGGRIEGTLVKEGQMVNAGETLAWMSSTERAALLDAARSQGEEGLKYWQQAYKPTPLVAPIDGEVIVRAVEPGQSVTSSDAVIVLSDRLIVKAQVDETDIGKVKLGQEAVVNLDAYPQVKVEAEVDHISYESNIVNNVTVYEVDILPREVPSVFRSGMSANVNIIETNKENVLLIPLEAVKQDKEGDYVMLSRGIGKKAIQRRIKLGVSDEQNVEVISGLEPGDNVIVMTQQYLPSKDRNSKTSPFMPSPGRR